MDSVIDQLCHRHRRCDARRRNTPQRQPQAKPQRHQAAPRPQQAQGENHHQPRGAGAEHLENRQHVPQRDGRGQPRQAGHQGPRSQGASCLRRSRAGQGSQDHVHDAARRETCRGQRSSHRPRTRLRGGAAQRHRPGLHDHPKQQPQHGQGTGASVRGLREVPRSSQNLPHQRQVAATTQQ